MSFAAILITLVTAIIGSFGAIYLKKGARDYKFPFEGLFTNINLIIGIVLYVISLIIFIAALRLDRISLLYPIVATAYIWISLLSIWILKEKMNLWKWIGIFLIVIGISFIGIS